MENQNNTLWENLAIVFRDEINIQTILSELIQNNHSQLENLETLSISGSTLIGGGVTTLHVVGPASENDFSKERDKLIFHELGNLTGWKYLTILLSSNNVKAKHLQIFLRGRSNRNFSSLPTEVCKLTNLEKLVIDTTNLQSIPPEIENLQKLENLNLSNNALQELPKEIEKLLNIKQLYLKKNPFDKLPINIIRLPNLQYLNLDSTHINELPVDLHKLANLRSLNLDNTNLSRLPNQVTDVSNLLRLDISYNKLVALPAEIRKLKNLTHLYASHNNITSLPPEIGYLEILRYLDISNNSLTSLPAEITKLSLLEEFDVRNNKLDIPPEILEKTIEPKAIFSAYFGEDIVNIQDLEKMFEDGFSGYFRKVFKTPSPLREAKILFLGQGSVGKTSLVQQILHGTFDQSQTKTEGISINQWQITGDKRKSFIGNSNETFSIALSPFRLNIWDFGGQEIMHATHQFFLTKRSLYLLVLDARLTQEENRVEYWLKIIQSFGGESPVLIVGNKTDQHPLDIDRTGLQKKYPNIVGILETSAATGAGIEALKAEIAKQVDNLPHVRDLLPETWFTVKSKLEKLAKKKNFFTQEDYLKLCSKNNVTDETSQHTLIGFLHDLGVVLHFQDDPRLEALGILNPQWVTNGVYKILNSHELFQSQGTLTLSILNKTLTPP